MGKTNRRDGPGTVAELIKWKLSLAVAFSSVTGYFLFGGRGGGDLYLVAAGVFLLAAGAAALNQYTERKSDALMERTMGRPLPSGKIESQTALIISGLLLAAGSLMLSLTGLLPLMLGIINVILYNAVYTGLKKITTLAIVPGAVVGAIPPFIGYTAAGGAMTDTVILLFALFMFLWQIPHFWILLIRYGREYQKAGIKTIYGAIDNRQIGRLVFHWVTASSLLLWVLTGMFMPFKPAAGMVLLLLNVTFIIFFYRIIFKGRQDEEMKSAFILMNSFTLLIMLILIATS